jgi:hypothetical protein
MDQFSVLNRSRVQIREQLRVELDLTLLQQLFRQLGVQAQLDLGFYFLERSTLTRLAGELRNSLRYG